MTSMPEFGDIYVRFPFTSGAFSKPRSVLDLFDLGVDVLICRIISVSYSGQPEVELRGCSKNQRAVSANLGARVRVPYTLPVCLACVRSWARLPVPRPIWFACPSAPRFALSRICHVQGALPEYGQPSDARSVGAAAELSQPVTDSEPTIHFSLGAPLAEWPRKRRWLSALLFQFFDLLPQQFCAAGTRLFQPGIYSCCHRSQYSGLGPVTLAFSRSTHRPINYLPEALASR